MKISQFKITSLKGIFLFLPFLTLISCEPSSKVKISSLENQAEEFLKPTLKDPSSYQKISSEVLDTVKMSKSLEEDVNVLISQDSTNKLIAELKANPAKDSLAYIRIRCKYRAKNSFGALEINEAIIYYFPTRALGEKKFEIAFNKAE